MSEYSKLSNEDLTIAVVKALGWRVERRKPHEDVRYDKWCLVAPDGSVCAAYAVGRFKPGEEECILVDTPYDFLRDLGACWRLFPETEMLTLHYNPATGYSVAVNPVWEDAIFEKCEVKVRANTPERALLLCFLTWKERPAK